MYDRQFIKKRRRRRIAAIVACASAMMITSLVIVSMLGRFTGTFTVSLKNSEVRLSLSKTKDFGTPSTFLRIDKLQSFEETTYKNLPGDDVLDNEQTPATYGVNKDPETGDEVSMNYFKYTFYIRNSGEKTAQFNMSINFEDRSKSDDGSERMLDDTLRVMLYENDVIDGQEDTHTKYIYAKESAEYNIDMEGNKVLKEFVSSYPYENKEDKNHPLVDESFVSGSTVAKISAKNFKKGDIKRYTLVVWLEGEDPQSTNDKESPVGASLKLGIQVTAYTAYAKD